MHFGLILIHNELKPIINQLNNILRANLKI